MLTIKEEDLQVCLNAYSQGKLTDRHLYELFYKLASDVFGSKSCHFDHPNPYEVLNEAASLCLKKVDRYGDSRYKATNFFVTIIGCSFAQSRQLLKWKMKKSILS